MVKSCWNSEEKQDAENFVDSGVEPLVAALILDFSDDVMIILIIITLYL